MKLKNVGIRAKLQGEINAAIPAPSDFRIRLPNVSNIILNQLSFRVIKQ